jgi:hypothetical protein
METEQDPAVYLFHLNESTDDLDASDRRDREPTGEDAVVVEVAS